MRALVVYESMFGNTRDVAEAIADGLRTWLDVVLSEVGVAPTEVADDVQLLVAGGPTHAHGMTTAQSRADSAKRFDGALVSPGIGIREWLDEIAQGRRVPHVALFDTRLKGPGLLWGSAASSAEKQLRPARIRPIVPPESFLVGGPTGPVVDRLIEGELDRARAWGSDLGARIAKRARTPVEV